MSHGNSDPPPRPQPRELLTVLATAHDAIGVATEASSLESQALEIDLGLFAASLAGGDAPIVHHAGLPRRERTLVAAPPTVCAKPGKHPGEAILTWPRGPGASAYALEVNFTPHRPSGPWTALVPGTGHRRVVKTPAPASAILARVARIDGNGNVSEWSEPVLVTTR